MKPVKNYCNIEIKYNIWHIDVYVECGDYDDPSDCNTRIDYIIDAKFTKGGYNQYVM